MGWRGVARALRLLSACKCVPAARVIRWYDVVLGLIRVVSAEMMMMMSVRSAGVLSLLLLVILRRHLARLPVSAGRPACSRRRLQSRLLVGWWVGVHVHLSQITVSVGTIGRCVRLAVCGSLMNRWITSPARPTTQPAGYFQRVCLLCNNVPDKLRASRPWTWRTAGNGWLLNVDVVNETF